MSPHTPRHGLPADDVEEALAWAEGRPWSAAMADCAQDPEWHAEGDVWTHTRAVCRALPTVEGWHGLAPTSRSACVMAALFHDAGKPRTTRLDPATARVVARGHAAAGAALARRELARAGCPTGLRETIVALVRHHGLPPRILDREDPVREVIRLSWLLDTRLLGIVARADARGRVCRSSAAHGEDAIDLWDLVCREHGCDGRAFAFANDQARFRYFREPGFDRTHAPHESYRCTVTMVCGLPGSGKDTWLARQRPGLSVVSLDSLRDRLDVAPEGDQGSLAQAARERCRGHLRARRDFAFNATNLTARVRARWVELFARYDARIEMVHVDVPLATALARNRARPRPVPEAVVRRLHERCEPPTWLECHALLREPAAESTP